MNARLWGFALFVAVAIASAWWYVAWRDTRPPASSATESLTEAELTQALTALRAHPHVYFASTENNKYGQVIVASLDAPNDRRVTTPLNCDRIDFGINRGVCLVDNRRNMLPPAIARIVDRDLHPIASLDLPGLPSRTRISPDDRYAASTVFVRGESYGSDFSTRTHIIDLEAGRLIEDLEHFTTWRDGKRFSAPDFNFWGVTFRKDSNRFYATLRSGSTTYLVEGDIAERRLQVLRTNVECPALSPDETRIAFKNRDTAGDGWRLHVLELATMKEWAIDAETRSIDDQIEWFNDQYVLYQFNEERGLPETAVNVWTVPVAADATEKPRVFIRGGFSPAVVR